MHPICLCAIAFLAYKVGSWIYNNLTSPIRLLRGPPGGFLLGHMKDFTNAKKTMQFFRLYGSTFKLNGPVGGYMLFTRDEKALHHILSRNEIYVKPRASKYMVRDLLGEGSVLQVEGEQHKRLRRILNPAFGSAQIRGLTEMFNSEALKVYLQSVVS
ncbi:hypothetical protein DL96DRAFT_1578289 [Flagelloscypha sp. PMI_526]|nr:hypothetical protein DL96DRAFT_1578289 [Flagelloscypha sp. PMI_526]